MKKLLLFLFFSSLVVKGFSQPASYVSGDVGIGQAYFLDAPGTTAISQNSIVIGTQYRIRVPFFNNVVFNQFQTQSLQIRIALGRTFVSPSGTELSPSLNALFSFTTQNSPTGQELVGTQIAAIPANFTGEFEFSVNAVNKTAAGTPSFVNSVINFVNNGSVGWLDNVSSNNQTTTPYTTTSTLPVKFTSLDAVNNNCVVNVSWNIAEQENVAGYEVEISKNGSDFGKTVRVEASNVNSYRASFAIPESMKSNILFIRVKSVDLDGKFLYSEVRSVRGTCDDQNRLVISGYPNPVTSGSMINIAAKEGAFKGKYRLELMDNNGKVYQVKEVQVDNVVVIPFEFKTALSPGNYLIRVSNFDGSQASTIQFVKVGGVL